MCISDRKFGVKARLSQALGVTLNLVKNYSGNPKVVTPIVHVLKLYSSNGKCLDLWFIAVDISHCIKVVSVIMFEEQIYTMKYSV